MSRLFRSIELSAKPKVYAVNLAALASLSKLTAVNTFPSKTPVSPKASGPSCPAIMKRAYFTGILQSRRTKTSLGRRERQSRT